MVIDIFLRMNLDVELAIISFSPLDSVHFEKMAIAKMIYLDPFLLLERGSIPSIETVC